MRRLYTTQQHAFSKIRTIGLLTGSYGGGAACVFYFAWTKLSKEAFGWRIAAACIIFSVLAVIIFTLVYEILYLSKEREYDTKMVSQLDYDLSRAEMTALRNTLDPHFIFNSLNTLSYLISRDSKKADLFNNKLAEVYKYFLLNKDKEVISAEKEIDFIKNYFSLLQIRHGSKLKLKISLSPETAADILVIPCALQVLIENAIKHNDFSHICPLQIFINAESDFLVIINTVTQKPATVDSHKIGLKNLKAQYLLAFNKEVVVEQQEKTFVVKLPLIRNIKTGYI